MIDQCLPLRDRSGAEMHPGLAVDHAEWLWWKLVRELLVIVEPFDQGKALARSLCHPGLGGPTPPFLKAFVEPDLRILQECACAQRQDSAVWRQRAIGKDVLT